LLYRYNLFTKLSLLSYHMYTPKKNDTLLKPYCTYIFLVHKISTSLQIQVQNVCYLLIIKSYLQVVSQQLLPLVLKLELLHVLITVSC